MHARKHAACTSQRRNCCALFAVAGAADVRRHESLRSNVHRSRRQHLRDAVALSEAALPGRVHSTLPRGFFPGVSRRRGRRARQPRAVLVDCKLSAREVVHPVHAPQIRDARARGALRKLRLAFPGVRTTVRGFVERISLDALRTTEAFSKGAATLTIHDDAPFRH